MNIATKEAEDIINRLINNVKLRNEFEKIIGKELSRPLYEWYEKIESSYDEKVDVKEVKRASTTKYGFKLKPGMIISKDETIVVYAIVEITGFYNEVVGTVVEIYKFDKNVDRYLSSYISMKHFDKDIMKNIPIYKKSVQKFFEGKMIKSIL